MVSKKFYPMAIIFVAVILVADALFLLTNFYFTFFQVEYSYIAYWIFLNISFFGAIMVLFGGLSLVLLRHKARYIAIITLSLSILIHCFQLYADYLSVIAGIMIISQLYSIYLLSNPLVDNFFSRSILEKYIDKRGEILSKPDSSKAFTRLKVLSFLFILSGLVSIADSLIYHYFFMSNQFTLNFSFLYSIVIVIFFFILSLLCLDGKKKWLPHILYFFTFLILTVTFQHLSWDNSFLSANNLTSTINQTPWDRFAFPIQGLLWPEQLLKLYSNQMIAGRNQYFTTYYNVVDITKLALYLFSIGLGATILIVDHYVLSLFKNEEKVDKYLI